MVHYLTRTSLRNAAPHANVAATGLPASKCLRHLSKTHGMKRKASSSLRDEIVDGILLQSWDQNGACGYWIVKPDSPSLVTSQFDNSLHQISVPRLSRLEEL